jgi:general stress protein YciG
MSAVDDLRRDGAGPPRLAEIIARHAKGVNVHEMLQTATSGLAAEKRERLIAELLGTGWTLSQIEFHVAIPNRFLRPQRTKPPEPPKHPSGEYERPTAEMIREAKRETGTSAVTRGPSAEPNVAPELRLVADLPPDPPKSAARLTFEEEHPSETKYRGFASQTPERRRAIGSLGGHAARAILTPEQASEIGRKGAESTNAGRRAEQARRDELGLPPIIPKGFGNLTPEERRERSRVGGVSAHAQGKSHEWTSEAAKVAGQKGIAARAANKARKAEGEALSRALHETRLESGEDLKPETCLLSDLKARRAAMDEFRTLAEKHSRVREAPEFTGVFDEIDQLGAYAPGGRKTAAE